MQHEPYVRPISQQVYPPWDTHVRGVWSSIKLMLLRIASEDVRLPIFGQLFRGQIIEDWTREVRGLVLWHDPNILSDSILSELQNGMLYYHQPFHCPTSVERLGLNCKLEYMNGNQVIIPEVHNIWVQYAQS